MNDGRRNLELVFKCIEEEDGEYQLVSMEMDGSRASSGSRENKIDADTFVWDAKRGLSAITLFFLEAAGRLIDVDIPFKTEGMPPGFKGISIWTCKIIDGKIPEGHPYRFIASLRNNLVGHNTNLYLIRLFYSLELKSLVNSHPDCGTGNPFEVLSRLKIKAQDKDDLYKYGRREYDKFAFLGCIVCRRFDGKDGGRWAEVSFCHSAHRQTRVQIFMDEKGQRRSATGAEIHAIRDYLRSLFDLEAPLEEPEHQEALENDSYQMADSKLGSNGSCEPEIESDQSECERIVPQVDRDNENTDQGDERQFRRRLMMFCGGAVLVGCLGLMLLLFNPWWRGDSQPDSKGDNNVDTTAEARNQASERVGIIEEVRVRNPVDVLLQRKSVVVVDQNAEQIWAEPVEGDVLEDGLQVVDLDGDSINEVLVPMKGRDMENGGQLIAYTAEREVRWVFDASVLKVPWQGPGQSRKMAINKVVTNDIWRTGKQQVIVFCLDAFGWFPSCMCLLDSDGTLINLYWNAGNLHFAEIGSETENGPKKLIISGLYNGPSDGYPGPKNKHPTSIFMLTPTRKVPRMEEAGALSTNLLDWYGVMLPKGKGISHIDVVDSNGDGVNEIAVDLGDGQFWDISFDGKSVQVKLGDSVKGETEFRMLFPDPK